jgi:hypothetical protein
MNKSLKNMQITIKPELAELDGSVIFAEQIAKAKEFLARVGLPDLEKIKKMQKNAK